MWVIQGNGFWRILFFGLAGRHFFSGVTVSATLDEPLGEFAGAGRSSRIAPTMQIKHITYKTIWTVGPLTVTLKPVNSTGSFVAAGKTTAWHPQRDRPVRTQRLTPSGLVCRP